MGVVIGYGKIREVEGHVLLSGDRVFKYIIR